MASFMSYFGGRRDPKQSARDAIVTLRQQLQMIEKKEEHLQKKIDEELKKAKTNAVSNKAGALAQGCLIFERAGELTGTFNRSGDCCSEAEEGQRGRAGPTERHTAAARNASEYTRVGELERRDNGRYEEGLRRAEGHSWQSVRFPAVATLGRPSDRAIGQWTRWMQRWLP